MNIDATTLQDLAIFHPEEAQSVFNTLNFTETTGGAYWLGQLLQQPFSQAKPIEETQAVLKLLLLRKNQWPHQVTNGTIMVLEKFYHSQIDKIPPKATALDGFFYKMLHGPDYSLIKYTVGHAIDFLQGMHKTVQLFDADERPLILDKIIGNIQQLLNKAPIAAMIVEEEKSTLSQQKILQYGQYLLMHYKRNMQQLIDLHGRLEAYLSLAIAIEKHDLHFPEFQNTTSPALAVTGLRHILLQHPVAYDVTLNEHSNFLFLTGANMAGKSTFIKAIGIAMYLAHIGMAVPAASMQLSIFDGIISNIQVSDNIMKGQSYFYNEVQRIRNTILRINNGQKWLVLIDELFKGTNVQDAMRCSSTVIKGLLKIKNSLFVLSTHLYEIGEELQPYSNITFKYFETNVTEDNLKFSYQLKEGVSNDRIGYLILKREGVVDMIDNL